MLRFAALLGTGALAVHQLRYFLAGGSPDGSVHDYLGPAGSMLAGVLVLALARALLGRRASKPRLRFLWPATALALIAIYSVQETAEGLSPSAHGGWVAVPLACVIALAIALVVRGTSSVAARARRPWRTPAPMARAAVVLPSLPLQARTGAPCLLPARGPPVTSA